MAAAPAVPGACTAFFQYQDASEEESDIELRSGEPGAAHPVHYTTQPLDPVNVTLPNVDFTYVSCAMPMHRRGGWCTATQDIQRAQVRLAARRDGLFRQQAADGEHYTRRAYARHADHA
jgi:hypothetical protein